MVLRPAITGFASPPPVPKRGKGGRPLVKVISFRYRKAYTMVLLLLLFRQNMHKQQ